MALGLGGATRSETRGTLRDIWTDCLDRSTLVALSGRAGITKASDHYPANLMACPLLQTGPKSSDSLTPTPTSQVTRFTYLTR